MSDFNFPHNVTNKVGNWQQNQLSYELQSNFSVDTLRR